MSLNNHPNNIGTFKEYDLHAELKNLYGSEENQEQQIDQFIVDVVTDKELVEIQTQNFSQIKQKLLNLLEKEYTVRLVHPIIIEKYYLTKMQNGEMKKRKSPKRNSLLQVFNELVYLIEVLEFPNFSLDVLLISANEERKKFQLNTNKAKFKTVNRSLNNVIKTYSFCKKQDFLFLLPYTIPEIFSTKELCKEMDIPYKLVSKIIYVFKKLNIIHPVSKDGNRIYYQKLIH